MSRLDGLDQIPTNRKSFRFCIYDSKEYSISGHMFEELVELTAGGASAALVGPFLCLFEALTSPVCDVRRSS